MEVNRRTFLLGTAAGLCGCLSGCQSGGLGDSAAAEAAQQGTLNAGSPSDYPRDGAYGKFIESDRVIMIRKAGRISAVSAICPHKSKLVEPVAEGGTIACPEHGSRFDLDGRVTKGPAKADLTHYAVTLAASGRIIVDKGRKLPMGDSAASVPV
jgi:nitrite reductase/ring-hydroxylating ferredoxin subunit